VHEPTLTGRRTKAQRAGTTASEPEFNRPERYFPAGSAGFAMYARGRSPVSDPKPMLDIARLVVGEIDAELVLGHHLGGLMVLGHHLGRLCRTLLNIQ
jgi:hypothetical protein